MKSLPIYDYNYPTNKKDAEKALSNYHNSFWRSIFKAKKNKIDKLLRDSIREIG